MVGATGFEPATSRSQSERSTKLSYAPDDALPQRWGNSASEIARSEMTSSRLPYRLRPVGRPRMRLPITSRGCSSMVEPQSSKLITRVRFPSSPLNEKAPPFGGAFSLPTWVVGNRSFGSLGPRACQPAQTRQRLLPRAGTSPPLRNAHPHGGRFSMSGVRNRRFPGPTRMSTGPNAPAFAPPRGDIPEQK